MLRLSIALPAMALLLCFGILTMYTPIASLSGNYIMLPDVETAFLSLKRSRGPTETPSPDLTVVADRSRNLFRYEIVDPSPPDAGYNTTFAEHIALGPMEPCRSRNEVLNRVEKTREILNYWHELAERLQIPYMIGWGSVIGYAREKNMTPYDRDLDIFIPTSAYEVLLPHAQFLPVNEKKEGQAPNFILLLNPPEVQATAPNHRTQLDCQGRILINSFDICTYQVLLGRVLHLPAYIDLYATDHLWEGNADVVIIREHGVSVFPASTLLPRRRCTYMDQLTYCPQDYRRFLLGAYGDDDDADDSLLKPDHACRPSSGSFYALPKRPLGFKPHLKPRAKRLDYPHFCQQYPIDNSLYPDCRQPVKMESKRLDALPHTGTVMP